MGLFDKLRAEFVDIIEWLDDTNHTLVWRFPRYRNQIKYAAQLIVRPGQSAVFVHQGRIADVFGPGHYRLETKNLPVLSTLMGWMHGFDSPFKAEIYFVSTRQFTDQKWGTPNPVMMRDADFGPVRIRAFGSYAYRITDPAMFIREIVGTNGLFTTDEINGHVKRKLVSAFAATSVLRSRHATVIGPTPPGTGVMAPATSLAEAKCTSPTRWLLP